MRWWKSLDGELRVIVCFAVPLCIFLLWVAVALPIQLATEAECLRLGYREALIDWHYNRYCVVRIDQTDRVVPLSVAREEPLR